MVEEALFWADQKAQEVATRDRFRYVDKEVEHPDKFVVKTSASISGVLHIGRLSDTVRGESVSRALQDQGYNAGLIWVAEDMDPLRKIPEGVPADYEEYIGMPVTDVPDPWGCHDTYSEHHVSKYLEVIDEFTAVEMEKFSMREEYRKGNFDPYIKKILGDIEAIIDIQNRYRSNPLPEGWSPFTPICKGCGKIITPKVQGIADGKVEYVCQDYDFEKYTAKGCGHHGFADPLKDPGKLMWKSEWAAQWARWEVSSEGAGKEYVPPSSAFWINAEIVEKVLGYPAPVPIFYEHIMIDGEKMSASVGNVVYPHDWLQVAPAQLLRFFYNKKLMKTRSFSWQDLPRLFDEYDNCAGINSGALKTANEKEERQLKSLYNASQMGEPKAPNPLPYSHASFISQVFTNEDDIVRSLKRSGHYDEDLHDDIIHRVDLARVWAEKYLPEESRFSLDIDVEGVRSRLSVEQKLLLKNIADLIAKNPELNGDEIQNFIYETAKQMGLSLGKAFQAIYLATMDKTRGPKAGTFLASILNLGEDIGKDYTRSWLYVRLKDVAK